MLKIRKLFQTHVVNNYAHNLTFRFVYESDDSPITYLGWFHTEPDNASNWYQQDCTEYDPSKGGWNDTRCSDDIDYVCERPK